MKVMYGKYGSLRVGMQVVVAELSATQASILGHSLEQWLTTIAVTFQSVHTDTANKSVLFSIRAEKNVSKSDAIFHLPWTELHANMST